MNIILNAVDCAVIGSYFLLVFLIAWRVTKKDYEKSEDYFLGGRNLGWFAIGASLFASNIGSEHLIGLAGAGAKGGVAVGQFEILAGFCLLLLGWLFTPFYLKSGVATMPEFLEKRYGKSARNYLSFISVIAYILTKISATIFAGAVLFEAIGLDFWWGASAVVIFTGIYTVLGGLKAVIYTDTMQVFIMLAGSLFVTFLALGEIGGWQAFTESLEPEFFNMWKAMDHPEFPWTGILFGAPILGVWFWCTDQFIVQRVLSAKNISEARRGTLFAGFLKILPIFIFVFPGMMAAVLANKGLLVLEKTDHALPALMGSILPTGIKGLAVAGLLAALMSSLSSVFNSCSTLITYDWYKRKNPEASEKQLFKVGQISTIALVVLGMAWIPMMSLIQGGLFTYLQSVQAYISPPIACVFLWGVFYKVNNEKGAMASLWTGFALGIGRLVLEINKSSLSGVLLYIAEINFLHYALLIFITCTIVLFLVSNLNKNTEKMNEIAYLTINQNFKEDLGGNRQKDFLLSLLLIFVTAVIWLWLS